MAGVLLRIRTISSNAAPIEMASWSGVRRVGGISPALMSRILILIGYGYEIRSLTGVGPSK
jgi:hypothetical protein